MIEIAEIFRRYGPQYRARFGTRMLPSHRRAMRDIEQCRTEALGGQVYYCDQCEESRYSYHSCKNRHCPKCQNDAAQQWLEEQQDLLLPVPYFLVTFTLPEGLRAVVRSHQTRLYNLLFHTSAAALQQLARDPRFVGGQIGMVGVLHTWTRDLMYHPHIHYLVPAGGLAPDGQVWLASRPGFLVHVRPLGRLFRAQFRAALQKSGLFDQVPGEVWSQEWVVHSQPVGSGVAALKYLAPYIFRVAISNRRIVKWQEDQVTFRYTASDTGKTKYCTLTAEEFIRRFLQHVLPKGFVKVRYYGFFSPGQRPLLHRVRQLLELQATPQRTGEPEAEPVAEGKANPAHSGPVYRCPKCGQTMRWVEVISPIRGRPP